MTDELRGPCRGGALEAERSGNNLELGLGAEGPGWELPGQREDQPGSRMGCEGCFGRARLPALSGVAGVASSPRRGSWHGKPPILLGSS